MVVLADSVVANRLVTPLALKEAEKGGKVYLDAQRSDGGTLWSVLFAGLIY